MPHENHLFSPSTTNCADRLATATGSPSARRSLAGLVSSTAAVINATSHRWVWPAATLALLAIGGVGTVWDAARQRAKHRQAQPAIHAIVRVLGTADMALSSASRWLRHPSLSEPGAAFADAPAILDADPAGAVIAPPVAVLAGTAVAPAVPIGGSATP